MANVELFFSDVQQNVLLPPRTTAQDAAVAVLCTVTRRIERGEARDFAQSMPPPLRDLLHGCTTDRPEAAEVFDRLEFVRRVGERLGVDRVDAEPVAQTVFVAMNRHLPRQQIDDVESQLPPDLKDMWRPPEFKRAA